MHGLAENSVGHAVDFTVFAAYQLPEGLVYLRHTQLDFLIAAQVLQQAALQ